ncbi:hypothetical protein T12_8239 [Trichinella patagoniensis]|uniref:Uncharacterized protein n=1 Tax=Trichinella patagoniensis TaxID=990121 RepID=A0A0V1A530_9BILA|nr:hypothetical protein T12_8239 [Trichinella patagoniensis]
MPIEKAENNTVMRKEQTKTKKKKRWIPRYICTAYTKRRLCLPYWERKQMLHFLFSFPILFSKVLLDNYSHLVFNFCYHFCVHSYQYRGLCGKSVAFQNSKTCYCRLISGTLQSWQSTRTWRQFRPKGCCRAEDDHCDPGEKVHRRPSYRSPSRLCSTGPSCWNCRWLTLGDFVLA